MGQMPLPLNLILEEVTSVIPVKVVILVMVTLAVIQMWMGLMPSSLRQILAEVI